MGVTLSQCELSEAALQVLGLAGAGGEVTLFDDFDDVGAVLARDERRPALLDAVNGVHDVGVDVWLRDGGVFRRDIRKPVRRGVGTVALRTKSGTLGGSLGAGDVELGGVAGDSLNLDRLDGSA